MFTSCKNSRFTVLNFFLLEKTAIGFLALIREKKDPKPHYCGNNMYSSCGIFPIRQKDTSAAAPFGWVGRWDISTWDNSGFASPCMYKFCFAFPTSIFCASFSSCGSLCLKIEWDCPFCFLAPGWTLCIWETVSKWNCLEIISKDYTADFELKEVWLEASFAPCYVSWKQSLLQSEIVWPKWSVYSHLFLPLCLGFGLSSSSALVVFSALPHRAQIWALFC